MAQRDSANQKRRQCASLLLVYHERVDSDIANQRLFAMTTVTRPSDKGHSPGMDVIPSFAA
jgi:hypothetical protein